MKANTKRILLIASVLFASVLVVASWTTIKVIGWVRGLPNRVVIDGDAIANAYGQAAIKSYHLALRGSDTTVQLQVLNEQFEPLIRQNTEGAAWIRNEYTDDITALIESDDPAVSAAASNLLSLLDAQP